MGFSDGFAPPCFLVAYVHGRYTIHTKMLFNHVFRSDFIEVAFQ
jgi:hypothetical protein